MVKQFVLLVSFLITSTIILHIERKRHLFLIHLGGRANLIKPKNIIFILHKVITSIYFPIISFKWSNSSAQSLTFQKKIGGCGGRGGRGKAGWFNEYSYAIFIVTPSLQGLIILKKTFRGNLDRSSHFLISGISVSNRIISKPAK